MGGQKSKPLPPPPKKTVKEMTKEFSKTIRKQQREFQREINKLEMNNKKINSDIERMVKKKDPRSTIKIVAANIPKNSSFIKKYQRLDA